MAKKGAVQQLQAEINTDEEFESFIRRDGVLVLDIYAEWCGPCIGMLGTLKKVKLEMGGDDLQLAICKSDNISYLERFRNKSEPTWLFLSHGKVVNCFFGTNVPKFTQLIADELMFESMYKSGTYQRRFYEWNELTPIEQQRANKHMAIENEKKRIELETQIKHRHDYIMYVTDEIMERLSDAGVTLVMPNYAHERDIHKKISDPADNCGLTMKDRRHLTMQESDLEVILFDLENPLHPEIYKRLFEEEILAIFWKTHDTELRDVLELLQSLVDILCNPQPLMDESGEPHPELKMPPVYKPWKFEVPIDVYEKMVKEHGYVEEELPPAPEVVVPEDVTEHGTKVAPSTTETAQTTIGTTQPIPEAAAAALAASAAPDGTQSEKAHDAATIASGVHGGEVVIEEGGEEDKVAGEEGEGQTEVEPEAKTEEKQPPPQQPAPPPPIEIPEIVIPELVIESPLVDESNLEVTTVEPEPEPEPVTATISVPPIYTPSNKRGNAALIFLYFRHLTDHFLPPDPVPEPVHLAIAYDAAKRRDVLEVMAANPQAILAYGYFNKIDPDSADLLAKTHQSYSERTSNPEDKLIIKVAKKTSHALLAFVGLGPTYVSFNTDEGMEECKKFFPHGYNDDEDNDDTETNIKKEDNQPDIQILHLLPADQEQPVAEVIDAEQTDAVEGVEGSIPPDASTLPPQDASAPPSGDSAGPDATPSDGPVPTPQDASAATTVSAGIPPTQATTTPAQAATSPGQPATPPPQDGATTPSQDATFVTAETTPVGTPPVEATAGTPPADAPATTPPAAEPE